MSRWKVETPAERFWPKVDKTGTCWIWTAAKDEKGYGQFWIGPELNNRVRAHRFAYEAIVGPIPYGMQLDHLCRTPSCVRPDHLEPVTNRENTLRGTSFVAVNVAKTHCKRGHPLEGENLLTRVKNGNVHRRCRICDSEAKMRWQREHRNPGPRPPVTHCVHGHEYTPENTYLTPKGARRCRECARQQEAKRRPRRAA